MIRSDAKDNKKIYTPRLRGVQVMKQSAVVAAVVRRLEVVRIRAGPLASR